MASPIQDLETQMNDISAFKKKKRMSCHLKEPISSIASGNKKPVHEHNNSSTKKTVEIKALKQWKVRDQSGILPPFIASVPTLSPQLSKLMNEIINLNKSAKLSKPIYNKPDTNQLTDKLLKINHAGNT